tara:strand:+ start:285 stop:737 length:453 start_codon:yes stop_codon:yes gene_type:complete
MKFLIPIILLLAACSQPAPVARIAQTPSGYPEAIFSGISAQKLANKFAGDCMKSGLLVIVNSANQVKCESKMNDAQIRWAKAYVGNQYSSDIHQYLQYNLTEIDGQVRVQAREWIQLQMPYGQIRRSDFTKPKVTNGLQKFLYDMGGKPV